LHRPTAALVNRLLLAPEANWFVLRNPLMSAEALTGRLGGPRK
jgi:hypothetical protein